MKKYIILCLATLLFGVAGFAKDIVVKSPGYFKDSVRDGHKLFPDSLLSCRLVPQGISYPNSDYQTTDEALVLAGA